MRRKSGGAHSLPTTFYAAVATSRVAKGLQRASARAATESCQCKDALSDYTLELGFVVSCDDGPGDRRRMQSWGRLARVMSVVSLGHWASTFPPRLNIYAGGDVAHVRQVKSSSMWIEDARGGSVDWRRRNANAAPVDHKGAERLSMTVGGKLGPSFCASPDEDATSQANSFHGMSCFINISNTRCVHETPKHDALRKHENVAIHKREKKIMISAKSEAVVAFHHRRPTLSLERPRAKGVSLVLRRGCRGV